MVGSCAVNPASQAEGKINYQLLRKDFKSRGGKYVSCRSASSLVSRHCIKSFETSYFLSLFGGGHEKETAHALQQRASMIDFLSSLLSSACRFRSLVSSGGENKLSTTPERFQIWRRKIRQLPISFQSRHCITSFETSDFLSLFGSGQEKETAHALQERASVIYFFSSLVSLQIQISGHKGSGTRDGPGGGENKLSTTPERFQIRRQENTSVADQIPVSSLYKKLQNLLFFVIVWRWPRDGNSSCTPRTCLCDLFLLFSRQPADSDLWSQAEGKINYQLLRKDFKSGGRNIPQLPISFQSRHCITSFETSYFLSLIGGGHKKETAHALQERASVIDFFSSRFSLQIQISGVKFHSLLADVLKIPVHPDSWAHHLSESTGTKRTRLLGISTLRLAKNKSCCNTIL
ncbi:hypothetical protein AgCh_008358 [Apium graveolens]